MLLWPDRTFFTLYAFCSFFQTVGFDAPAQLNKGTSTEESEADEADHFYYLTSSSPHVSGFEDDPNNCHLCHHNLALSPLTQLGVGTYILDMLHNIT